MYRFWGADLCVFVRVLNINTKLWKDGEKRKSMDKEKKTNCKKKDEACLGWRIDEVLKIGKKDEGEKRSEGGLFTSSHGVLNLTDRSLPHFFGQFLIFLSVSIINSCLHCDVFSDICLSVCETARLSLTFSSVSASVFMDAYIWMCIYTYGIYSAENLHVFPLTHWLAVRTSFTLP